MAYVVESIPTIATGTSQTIDIGSPLTNDLILIFLGVGGSATYTTPTGYSPLYTSTNTVRQYCWYKVALSDSEVDPTTTASFSSSSAFVTVIIRDVDTTTPITSGAAGYATSTFTNDKEPAAPTLTTGVGKTKNLILHAGSILTDSLVSDFSKTTAVGRAVFGGTMFVAKEWVENASTATSTFDWLTNQSASRTGNLAVVSINNKTSGGDGLRDISCLMTNTRLVKPYPYGTSETLAAPDTILVGATPLDGLVAASSAAAVSTTGTLSNSYLTSLNVASATNFGADTWAGFSWATPSTLNFTGKIVGFAWNPSNAWSTSTTDLRGVAIVFSDSTGDWVAYKVRPLASAYLNTDHIEFISPGVSTAYGSSGTITWSDITNITWVYARQSGQTAQPFLNIASLYLFDGVSTLVGGSATKPVNGSQIYKHVTQYIDSLGTTGLYPFGAFQGSGQFLGYTPIQLGNGTIPTYVDLVANSLETPPDSTRTNDFDVTDGAYGMTLYGSSTCTFDLRSAIIASTSLQNFTMHASSSLSASLLTTGASFIGRTFSDLAGYDWTTVSWSECDTVTIGGGGNLTGCTVASTASTNAALAVTDNGSVLDNCTIDGTGAAYAFEIASGVKEITIASSAITTGSTNKGHILKTAATVTAGAFVTGDHYEIKTVGTTDFTLIGASANTIGERFTATGAGSGTGDAYAAVKITTSGTTSLTEGEVTSAGAVVWVAAPELYQSVTVSGAIDSSQIHVADVDYTLTVSGITITPTAGATYTNNDITWTVVSASITAGAGTIVVYGLGTPATSGTLTKASGTGDASVAFSAFVRNVTTLYNGAPTFPYTWTDSVAAAAARAIRLRVAYCQTTSARSFIESYIGVCGITDGSESVSYNASQVADATYNTHALDGPAILALGEITISDLGTDLITVDTAGGTMGWPTIYAAFVAWMASSSGIDDEIAYCDSPDPVNFIWENTRIKCPLGTALSVTDGWGRDSVTGLSITLWNNTGGAIGFSADHGIGYSTGSGLTTAQNAKLMALPDATDIATEVVTGITF